jgi:uncharacterized membrane protein (UPF0127 family)
MDRQQRAAVNVIAGMIDTGLMRALVFGALAMPCAIARAEMPEIILTVGNHKLTAEVAFTENTRSQGLMHRRMLPENRGMLFVFPRSELHAMWMMNTYVPLSVAFLDAQGIIINIADMTPHTTTAHPAIKPAKYALEMNLGWFRKRGIGPGARIEGIEKAPPAR